MGLAAPFTILINDQPRRLDGAAVLADIANELGIGERKGVAIAINGAVVPRATWPSHALNDGDRLLVIRATQGG